MPRPPAFHDATLTPGSGEILSQTQASVEHLSSDLVDDYVALLRDTPPRLISSSSRSRRSTSSSPHPPRPPLSPSPRSPTARTPYPSSPSLPSPAVIPKPTATSSTFGRRPSLAAPAAASLTTDPSTSPTAPSKNGPFSSPRRGTLAAYPPLLALSQATSRSTSWPPSSSSARPSRRAEASPRFPHLKPDLLPSPRPGSAQVALSALRPRELSIAFGADTTVAGPPGDLLSPRPRASDIEYMGAPSLLGIPNTLQVLWALWRSPQHLAEETGRDSQR